MFNYGWELPGATIKGFAGRVAGGWNLSGVVIVQDGNPLTITDAGGGSVYGTGSAKSGEGGTSRAQLCPGVTYSQLLTSGGITSRLGGASGGPGYFNTAGFCNSPIVGSDGIATGFGNSGIGIVQGPGQVNWDTSVSKRIRLTEKQKLEFRTEFFNIPQSPQLWEPGLNPEYPRHVRHHQHHSRQSPADSICFEVSVLGTSSISFPLNEPRVSGAGFSFGI